MSSQSSPSTSARDTIEGRAALIVIDIQASCFNDTSESEDRAIPHMKDYAPRMLKARAVIDKARECDIPVVFIQEIHRANLVDFGRELDGKESIHCLDSNPDTDLAREQMGVRPDDYHIQKRRYSAFFGTDLEILLRGLKVQTLILVGGLTDVCVHYTFVDGHQSDYFCRVIEDCVAGSSIEAHQASLNAMEYLQTGAVQSREQMLIAMEHSKRKPAESATE
jgi:nicotinamidase-related amidase